jgi:hypothetical protein
VLLQLFLDEAVGRGELLQQHGMRQKKRGMDLRPVEGRRKLCQALRDMRTRRLRQRTGRHARGAGGSFEQLP